MITKYEGELIAHLARELNPKHRVSSVSMKTDPLSDDCKYEIRTLLERRGYRVEFPCETVETKDSIIEQHFIRIFAVKTG